eukprot:2808501-Pleurochrysis_carterae.AAC.2
MYDTLRGEAGSAVKLSDKTTGLLRSQTHPRAARAKQVWPLTNGCGRTRLSGSSRMVVRSSRSVSSQAR